MGNVDRRIWRICALVFRELNSDTSCVIVVCTWKQTLTRSIVQFEVVYRLYKLVLEKGIVLCIVRKKGLEQGNVDRFLRKSFPPRFK